mmetsp:Transcript_50145/g.89549  ORF Transcript_50145/g.89549 Transcript_50145/m.89549 type:complete len:85 (+) Transcript_50145:160-414(+)
MKMWDSGFTVHLILAPCPYSDPTSNRWLHLESSPSNDSPRTSFPASLLGNEDHSHRLYRLIGVHPCPLLAPTDIVSWMKRVGWG